MAIYLYKGLDKTGKDIKSEITADTEVQAKTRLKSQGIMLISIKEQKSQKRGGETSLNITFGPRVKADELSLMTRQLATLIKANIQIVEAFSALIDQTESEALKIILSEIRQKVNEGTSLAKALGAYPDVFDHVYANMVEAGEASGTLPIVLLRLAEFTEAQVKLRGQIKSAMTYPIIMVVVGSGMMGMIFITVIPKITKIFISMKKELPLPTQICIWISDFLVNYWWAVLIGLYLGWNLFKKSIKTKKGKLRWHSFLLKAPIIGKMLVMINVSRFCSTLATLLSSGVPILAAMKIVKSLISNIHIQEAVEASKISLAEGGTLNGPLTKSQLFPPMVTHMIALGERSGELEPMLNIIAENYEEQVQTKLSGLTSVLEPIMMIGMGGAVAFIVFAVISPMLELNTLH